MGKGSFYGSSALPTKLPPMKRESVKKELENTPDKSSFIGQEQYAYEDLNISAFQTAPSNIIMGNKARNKIFSCPTEWKKRKVEIAKIRAGEEDDDFERGPEMKDPKDGGKELTDLKQVQNAVNNKEWVDLDRYIELLLDSKSEDETVFIY